MNELLILLQHLSSQKAGAGIFTESALVNSLPLSDFYLLQIITIRC